jgi:hypothetical protein
VPLAVVARRDDTLMITDSGAGPGAILYLAGETPAVFHKDTALAAGYWVASEDPLPKLPDTAVTQLNEFNARWAKTQQALPPSVAS